MQHSKAPTRKQNNSFDKATGNTCYQCNGKGHKSNVCPLRIVDVVTKEREREEEKEQPTIEEDEYAGVEFDEEEFDERVTFVLQRMLLASKDEGKRNNLFKTHYYVKNKACNMIMDSGIMENLVSKKLVDSFKLSIEPHEKPYTLGWVSRISQVRVILQSSYLHQEVL